MANSKRKCRYCRQYGRPEQGVIHGNAYFCNDDHAAKYAFQHRQKGVKKLEQEHRRQKRRFYDRDISHQLRLTQTAVNRLAKLLDAGKPCISCGRPDEGGRKRNASHLKSRGANSGLRFDLRNIHDACVVCNQYQSGNIQGFREGIVERYGQKMLDYLDSAERLRKWPIEALKTIRQEANAETRRLEKGLPPSKDWRTIPRATRERAA